MSGSGAPPPAGLPGRQPRPAGLGVPPLGAAAGAAAAAEVFPLAEQQQQGQQQQQQPPQQVALTADERHSLPREPSVQLPPSPFATRLPSGAGAGAFSSAQGPLDTTEAGWAPAAGGTIAAEGEGHDGTAVLGPRTSAAVPTGAAPPLPGTQQQQQQQHQEPAALPPASAAVGTARGGEGVSQRSAAGTESRPQQSAAPPARLRSGPYEARKSRFRGVQWDKNGGKWRARIHTDKTRHIGYYETEEEAGEAWDMAALRHFGAAVTPKLNFPGSVQKFEAATAAAAAAGAPPGAAPPEPTAAAAAAGAAVTAAGVALPAAAGTAGAGAAGAAGSAGLPLAQQAAAYRGVVALDGRWKATVQHRRNQVFVGMFETAEEAARAYDRENLRLNGRGAITNFPLSDYTADLQRMHSSFQSEQSLPSVPSDAAALAAAAAAVAAGGREATPNSRNTPFPLGTPAGALGAAGSGAGDGGGAAARKRRRGAGAGATAAAAAESGPGRRRRRGSAVGAATDSDSETESPASEAGPTGAPPGMIGVRQLPGSKWQASLSVDLGTFASPAEAARAYDRAALLATGLCSRTNLPLPEAVAQLAAAAAVSAGSPPGVPTPAQQQERWQGRLRGVVQRGGTFMAMLDIAGKSYELGPFATELEASKAYDRYSVLLYGVRAETNHPVFDYWAQPAEVQALLEAKQAVEAARQAATQQAGAEAGTQSAGTAGSADAGGAAGSRLPTRQQRRVASRAASLQEGSLPPPVPPPAAGAGMAAGPHASLLQGLALPQQQQQQPLLSVQQLQQLQHLQQQLPPQPQAAMAAMQVHMQAQPSQQQQQQVQVQVAAPPAQQAAQQAAQQQQQQQQVMQSAAGLGLSALSRLAQGAPLSAAHLQPGTKLTLGATHPLGGLMFTAGQPPALQQQPQQQAMQPSGAAQVVPGFGAAGVSGLMLPTPQPPPPQLGAQPGPGLPGSQPPQ